MYILYFLYMVCMDLKGLSMEPQECSMFEGCAGNNTRQASPVLQVVPGTYPQISSTAISELIATFSCLRGNHSLQKPSSELFNCLACFVVKLNTSEQCPKIRCRSTSFGSQICRLWICCRALTSYVCQAMKKS